MVSAALRISLPVAGEPNLDCYNVGHRTPIEAWYEGLETVELHDAITLTGEADFKLGDWWVRPSLLVLERGDESPHVEARTMAVLVCLARHAPALVTKERLLEEVWADTPFVSEEVISHAVWELRRALGDSARSPSYIQTIARKGYRLLVEVARPTGSPLPLPGARIAHYDLEAELGRGSMGVVWKAVDRRLDRPVAIKFLAPELTRDAEACRRFLREARLAASLDHPNLATVLEVGETSQGQLYLVTPFYAGGNLKDRLIRGPVPPPEASNLARQLAAGLAAAHRRGIVHRDVKPANLLLDEHGTLKLADFGIAKLLGSTDLTRTGAALGTPAYKSPEQSRGQAVDHRTDLWSAGVVLFELLTGRRPFDGEYEQAVVHSILANEPQALESADGHPVPEALRQIVAKAMAKEPSERYQSGEELVAALDAAAAGGPLPVAGGRRRFSRRWLAAAALGLAGIGFIGFREWPRPDPIAQEARDVLVAGQRAWLRGHDVKNSAKAKELFAQAVELEPTWGEALGHLAVYKADEYARRKRPEDLKDAQNLIARARRADPGSSLPLAAQARLDLLERQYAKAESVARNGIELERTCPKGGSCDFAYLLLAEAIWLQGKKDEAFKTLADCATVGEGAIRCGLKEAQLRREHGDLAKATVAYQAVLNLDDQQTTALNDLGLLYLEAGQPAAAAEALMRFVRATDDYRGYLNLGNAYYAMPLWDDAKAAYEKSIELARLAGAPDPLPALALGDVYMEQGDPGSATTWYRQALEIYEQRVAAGDGSLRTLSLRALSLAKAGRLEEADAVIESLLPNWRAFPDILVNAARIAAVKRDRAALLQRASQALGAGRSAQELKDDAAFIPYRKDEEYLRLLLSPHPSPP